MSSKHNLIQSVRQHSHTPLSLKWYYENAALSQYFLKGGKSSRKGYFSCFTQDIKVNVPLSTAQAKEKM